MQPSFPSKEDSTARSISRQRCGQNIIGCHSILRRHGLQKAITSRSKPQGMQGNLKRSCQNQKVIRISHEVFWTHDGCCNNLLRDLSEHTRMKPCLTGCYELPCSYRARACLEDCGTGAESAGEKHCRKTGFYKGISFGRYHIRPVQISNSHACHHWLVLPPLPPAAPCLSLKTCGTILCACICICICI